MQLYVVSLNMNIAQPWKLVKFIMKMCENIIAN